MKYLKISLYFVVIVCIIALIFDKKDGIRDNLYASPQRYTFARSDYYKRIDAYITDISKISENQKLTGFAESLEDMRKVMKLPARFIDSSARVLELHRLYEAAESMKTGDNHVELTRLQLEIMRLIKEDGN